MKMTPICKITLLSSLLAISGVTASSALATTATPHGAYVGLGLGSSDTNNELSNFENSNNQKPQAGAVTDSTGFGMRAYAGYRFIKYLSAEAGFTYFGDADADDMAYDNGTTGVSGKIKEHAYDVSLKAFYPIATQVDPFLDAGVAYVDSSTDLSGSNKGRDHNEFALRYGGGVNFNVTNNFAAGLSWDRIHQHNDIESADLVGLNLTYSFVS